MSIVGPSYNTVPASQQFGSTGLPKPLNYSVVPQVIPEQFKYPIPRRGEDITRTWKMLQPENDLYSTNSNKICRFTMPNDGIYDFRRSYFLTSVTLYPTVGFNGTYFRLPQGAFSIFERVRWLNGTQCVEEFDTYNRIMAFIWLVEQNPVVVDQIGYRLLGFGTQADRNALAFTNVPAAYTPVTTVYAIPIALGFANCGILPMNAMNTQYVELYLGVPTEIVESDSTGGQINISIINTQWYVEKLEGGGLMDDITSEVRSPDLSAGFMVQFDSWRKEEASAYNDMNEVKVTTRAEFFKGILAFFLDGSTRNNMAVNDRFYTWPKTNTNWYQFKINNTLYPEQAVDCTGEAIPAYFNYLNWANAWALDSFSDDAPNIELEDFNDQNFIITGDFLSNPKTELLNNVSTSNMAPDLVIRVGLATAAPNNQYKLVSLINYSTVVRVNYKDNFFIRS